MKRILGAIMAMLSIAAIILVFGATYFLVIEPNRITKPTIEKPPLPTTEDPEISVAHINYLINELEGYKLKPAPIDKEPAVIEFYLADVEEYYHTTITEHIPKTKEGPAESPDVRIVGDEETILTILEHSDLITATQEQLDQGTITTELFKEPKELGLKGYFSIYELFS